MLKIAYDFQIFSSQTHGGGSRYYSELIRNLRSKNVRTMFFGKYTDNEYFNNQRFLKGVYFPGKTVLMKEINKIYSVNQLENAAFDIFHPTNFNPYFLGPLGNRPLVVTIYDLIYEKFPKYFPKKNRFLNNRNKILKRADAIIAISENTKKDIEKFYGLGEKTSVIYLANSLTARGNNKLELPDKYLLYVGDRKGYKNFIGLLNSLPKGDYFLVCVGGGNFNREETQLIKSLGLDNKILHFSAPDYSLSEFYEKAIAFLYPSLYEGFGIPVLEAFACKCPVIASRTSSFPEVGGDACLYFDPSKRSEISEKIKLVLKDRKLRERMIEKGIKQEKNFSWNKTAGQTLDLYKSLVKKE